MLTLLSRALAPPSDKQLPLSLRDRRKRLPGTPWPGSRMEMSEQSVTPRTWCSPKGAILAPGTASPCSEASLQALGRWVWGQLGAS